MLLDILAAVNPGDGRRAYRQVSTLDVQVGTSRGLDEPGQPANRFWLSGFRQRRRLVERNGKDLGFSPVAILGDHDRISLVIIETFRVETIVPRHNVAR